MKIKDIISLNPIKTVVKLEPEAGAAEKQSLFRSFILTPDIEKSLKTIFKTFRPEKGQGFFLKGNFGTGKSHFLAFLDYFFTYSAETSGFFQQSIRLKEYLPLYESLKILTVPVSLLDYPADTGLDDIIFNAAEKRLLSNGIKASLAPEKVYLESFEKYFLKELQEDIPDYHRLSSADKIGRVKELILQKKDFHFVYHYDRTYFMEKLSAVLNQHGYSAVLFLIDELSEFLKAKSDAELLDEDVRFLQFLGETADNRPVYLIGSMQESIDEISEINSHIMKRISDRFKVRLELTAVHSREVILERLLHKDNRMREAIKPVYAKIKKEFPRFELSENDFIAAYPVDNNVFALLDTVTAVFSKTRGAVHFIYEALLSHQENEAESLIGPEVIFDHFKNKIQENPETNDLIDVVWEYFDKKIPQIFTDPQYIVTALRIIKLLLLSRLCKPQPYYTLKELAHFLRFKITDLSGDYNYEFLKENILDELCRQADYLVPERKENYLADRYKIELELNLNTIFENKKAEYVKRLSGRETNVLLEAFHWVQTQYLPLNMLINVPDDGKEYPVNWFYSRRKLKVWLKDFTKVDTAFLDSCRRLREKENIEIFAILGVPYNVETSKLDLTDWLKNEKDSIISRFLLIIPREIRPDELKVLLELAAVKKIGKEYEENKDDSRLINLAKTHAENLLIKVKAIFDSLYLPLNFFYAAKQFLNEQNHGAILPFDKELEKAGFHVLNVHYPDYPTYAPKVEYFSRGDQVNLIQNFIQTGAVSIKKAELTGLASRIEGILYPMKIVTKKEGFYHLTVSVDHSPLINEFFICLEQGCKTPAEIMKKMAVSRFGLIKDQFIMLFFALVFSGYIMPMKNGKKFPVDKLTIENLFEIDEINEGEIINDAVWDFLIRLPLFRDHAFMGKNIVNQRMLWDDLINYKTKLQVSLAAVTNADDLAKVQKMYGVIKKSSIPLILENIRHVYEAIRVSYSPKEGLDYFYEQTLSIPNLQHLFDRFTLTVEFYANTINSFNHHYLYLEDQLFIAEQEAYQQLNADYLKLKAQVNHLDSILFDIPFKHFNDQFVIFQADFSSKYCEYHSKFYDPKLLDPLKNALDQDNALILAGLMEFEYAPVEHSYRKITEQVNDIRQKFCTENPVNHLRFKNQCLCGLRLGEEKVVNSLTKESLLLQIDQGLREYIDYFQAADSIGKIEAYIYSMENEENLPELESLRKLIRQKNEPLIFYTRLLTPQLIQHLKNALSRKNIKIKPLQLPVLFNRLSGMRLDRAKLFRIIDDFLGPEIGEEEQFYSFDKFDKPQETNAAQCEERQTARDKFINVNTFIKNSFTDFADKILFILNNPPSVNLLRTETFKEVLNSQPDVIDNLKPAFRDGLPALILKDKFFCLNWEDDLYAAAFALAYLVCFLHHLNEKILCDLMNISLSKITDADYIDFLNFYFFSDLMISLSVEFLNKNHDLYAYSVFHMVSEIDRFNNNSLKVFKELILKKNILNRPELFWHQPNSRLKLKVIDLDAVHPYLAEKINQLDFILVLDSLSIDLWYLLEPIIHQPFDLLERFMILNQEKADTEIFRKRVFHLDEPFDEAAYRHLAKNLEVFFDADRLDVQYRIPEQHGQTKLLLFYNLIDKKIHTSHISYKELISEIKLNLTSSFTSLLNKIRPGQTGLILSDHGFRLRIKNKKITYSHDSLSLKEALTINFLVKRR